MTRLHRRRALALWIVLLSAYLLTGSGFDATEGLDDLNLADRLWRTGSIGSPTNPGGLVARGRDGRFYVSHDAGNAFGFIPAVAAAGFVQRVAGTRAIRQLPARQAEVFAALATSAAYVAATGVAVFAMTSVALGLGDLAGVGTTLAFGLCTIAWPYSRSLFDGVLAGLLVAWAYVMLFSYDERAPASRIVAAATLLGAAFVTRQTVGVLLPVAFGYVCYASGGLRRGTRAAVVFAAALAPWTVWQAWYNWTRTGAPWMPPTALPIYAGNNALDGNILVGLLGLLASPGKSMFLFSPVLVGAAFGLAAFARVRRPAFVLWLASVAAFLVLHAAIRNWAGEWGWGPRYTVSITALLILPLGFVIRRIEEGNAAAPLKRFVWMTTVAGVFVQLAALTINWHYRYAFLNQEHLLSRGGAAWGWRSGQFADALATAGRNLLRVAAGVPPPDVVANTHPLNVFASNRVNLWWVTAGRAGAPVRITAAIVVTLLLAGLAGAVWLRATFIGREPDAIC